MARLATHLEKGRESYAARRWADAHRSLSAAAGEADFAAGDSEMLARASYMLGLDDDYVGALEQAHHAYLGRDQRSDAARCAWWIGHNLLFRGEGGPARGWLARARRLLTAGPDDERRSAYVLLADLLEQMMAGDHEAAHRTAGEVVVVAERDGDDDVLALGLMESGHALVRMGRGDEGWRLVDETMVAVTAGELSPIVAGIVYCNTISFCHRTYEVRRAQEWTAALARWCAQQNDMVAHNGACLVHRAQLMVLSGRWPDALTELRRLEPRLSAGVINQRALGEAAYQQGELHRLRGELQAGRDAYLAATRLGREPQPGLALLRLMQGGVDAAAATIRRAVAETPQPLQRAALLPAYVEIMLAAGDQEAATLACRELASVAAEEGSEMLQAMSAHAHGELGLAVGDAESALIELRRACRLWEGLGARYESARARASFALACRALGDEDGASSELEVARSVLAELGAMPAVAWLDRMTGSGGADERHGLTARELEVLRLVAAGKSNRAIAGDLIISERTVARHLQNIFAKLRVSSRTAAGSFAYEHGLV